MSTESRWTGSNLLKSRTQHQLTELPQGATLFLTPAQCRIEGLPIACRDLSSDIQAAGLDPRTVYLSATTPEKKLYYISLENLKARLYQLTHQFVFAHQFTYYKQFRGDLRDLVSDFYYEFLTPKSRKGPELTLIDRYDFTITSFEYYVKNAVIRKLIDQSRQNPFQLSIESLTAEHGDSITRTFHLVSPEDSLDDNISEEQLALYRSRFSRMAEISRQAIISEFQISKNYLSPRLRDWFEDLIATTPAIPIPRPSLSGLYRRPVAASPSYKDVDEDLDSLLKLIGIC